MKTRLRSRLTYANVMATGAMFVALGGGAYALTGIPDANGVFHGCVSNQTGVLRVVSKASSCHKRTHHNPGETAISWNQQGVPGQDGATNVVIRASDPVSNANAATAQCQPGERAVGGGGMTSGDPITISAPSVNGISSPDIVANQVPNGWRIFTGSDTTGTRTAEVICAAP
jgi:hypothetical protein